MDPKQRYKSKYTGPQIDSGVSRALPGGEIDAALNSKMEIEFLVNVDFTNPVAQAGIGGLHGSVAYAVDRWKLISGTVSWSSNGLTLNGTIRQIREFPIVFPVVPSIEMHSGTATITYDDSTKYCDIASSGGVIKRPHLGPREITDWTKIPPSDRGEELRSCQRYYQKIDNAFGYGYTANGSEALIDIPVPVTMRTTPAITAASLGYLSTTSAFAVTALSVSAIKSNAVRLLAAGTGWPGSTVASLSGAAIALSADL